MNAPVTKDQLAFSLGHRSYIGPAYEGVQRASVNQGVQQATSFFRRIVNAISAWRQRQEVLREMQMMTDHELADIGLSRGDLARVFDPVFAEDHRRGHDYVAY